MQNFNKTIVKSTAVTRLLAKPQTGRTHYRTWKSGKAWLYGASVLALLAGGAALTQNNVQASTTLPSTPLTAASQSVADTGSIASAAVSSGTSSLSLPANTSNTAASTTAASSSIASATGPSSLAAPSSESSSSTAASSATSENTHSSAASLSASSSASKSQVATAAAAASIGTAKVYRIYNPLNGEHLYTENLNEAYTDSTQNGWNYEGIAWLAPTSGNLAVMRYYNPTTGLHLYTDNAAEESAVAREGWRLEGLAFYSAANVAGTIPIYRLYYPGDGNHLLTSSAYEKGVLSSSRGWNAEGVAFYAYSAGNISSTNQHLTIGATVTPVTTSSSDISVQVSDNDGGLLSYSTQTNLTVQWVNGHYQLTVTGLPAAASNPYFPTWSAANGQDDLVWYAGKKSGSTALGAAYAERLDSTGTVITDAYVTIAGTQYAIGRITYSYSGGHYYNVPLYYYSQLDSRWAGVYVGGYTFGDSGCVETDIAMIARGAGINVTPLEVGYASYPLGGLNNGVEGLGTDQMGGIRTAEAIGLQAQALSSVNQIETLVQSGVPVIFNVQSPFPTVLNTSYTHSVILSNYSNGSYYVVDPWNNYGTGWYSMNTLWADRSTVPGDNNANTGTPATAVYI